MAPSREWLEKDYYAVLGVPEDASSADIKKAYRKLAQQLHPDTNPDPGAEERFKEVNEAFDVIGSEDSRREYDEFRRLAASGGLGGFGGPGGFTFGDGADMGDLGDLLRSIFAGAGAGGGPGGRGFSAYQGAARPRKGADVRASVTLSFDDALRGVQTRLRITGDGPCKNCGGSGAKPGTSPRICSTCGGSGQETINQGLFSMAQPCRACAGSGRIVDDPDPVCDGTGRVIEPRELTVRIPAGVKDGATVRVPQRGQPGANGGPAGDVIVTVQVEPHRVFGRRGDDVTIDLPISFSEAALGTKLRVPNAEGEVTTIKIPAGTPSGKTFRIRGKGAPRAKGGGRGDLLVKVVIDVPTKLSRQQKKLLEELGAHDDTEARDQMLEAR